MELYDVEVDVTNVNSPEVKVRHVFLVAMSSGDDARRGAIEPLLDILPTGTWLIEYKTAIKRDMSV